MIPLTRGKRLIPNASVSTMLTILAEPQHLKRAGYGGCVSHIVSKFQVSDHVLDLLESLAISFGIKGDILLIEDTFSLLAGRSVQLCGFIELASLLGWRMETCNMSSVHVITTGCALNKKALCGDGTWGKPWDQISQSLRVYKIPDVGKTWFAGVDHHRALLTLRPIPGAGWLSLLDGDESGAVRLRVQLAHPGRSTTRDWV